MGRRSAAQIDRGNTNPRSATAAGHTTSRLREALQTLIQFPGVTTKSTPEEIRLIAARSLLSLLFFLLSSCSETFAAQAPQDDPARGFLARSYHSPGGETMQYRLFVPPGYDAAKRYPVVLWLHGANGRGSDNLLQISGGNFLGTHVWTAAGIQDKDPVFRSEERRVGK